MRHPSARTSLRRHRARQVGMVRMEHRHFCPDGMPRTFMRPACGTTGWQMVPGQGRATLTTLLADVTCKTCRRTRAFKAAAVREMLRR